MNVRAAVVVVFDAVWIAAGCAADAAAVVIVVGWVVSGVDAATVTCQIVAGVRVVDAICRG